MWKLSTNFVAIIWIFRTGHGSGWAFSRYVTHCIAGWSANSLFSQADVSPAAADRYHRYKKQYVYVLLYLHVYVEIWRLKTSLVCLRNPLRLALPTPVCWDMSRAQFRLSALAFYCEHILLVIHWNIFQCALLIVGKKTKKTVLCALLVSEQS